MESSPQIMIADDARKAAERAAAEFIKAVQTGMAGGANPSVALSGGSTPRRLHRLLTRSPYRKSLAWERVHFFWVDERLVPRSDTASNFGAAHEDLVDPLKLGPGQVHPMPVNGKPPAMAEAYEAVLKTHFDRKGTELPVFDLICLGLGKDGHTASLFPQDAALKETKHWVVAVEGGKPHVYRLTLTLPVINNARRIIFLVTGPDKAEIVGRALTQSQERLPVHRVQPVNGTTIWILDSAAAEGISKQTKSGRGKRP